MKELKRNVETGLVEVWEDGVKIGTIFGMGDLEGGERTGGDNGQRGQDTRGDR